MAQQSTQPPDDSASADKATLSGLFSDFLWMAAGFWVSPQRNRLIGLGGALVAVVGATAYMQIRLNSWNRPFYNALTNKDMPGFLSQLVVFGELAGILLVLNVAQMWLNQTSKVVMRQGLVDDLLNEWLKPKRAFRLSNSGVIGANPDQRLQADAQHLTDLSTDLGIGLLQSSLLLLLFVGVLWGLSQGEFLPVAGRDFAPPGYLVWCALLYAGAASYLSWRVGRPLINLNAEHYAREADFRFALVRINEHIDGITLYGGEADERQSLNGVFGSVLDISRQIVNAVTRLTWVTAGYGWFTIIAPILVAAPAYFRGTMSFGELMVIVGAFNQVQTALRWFVDNFSNLADWRATLLRVARFRKAILGMDDLGQATSRIQFAEEADPSIKIDDLHVASPAGCVMLSEPHANMKRHRAGLDHQRERRAQGRAVSRHRRALAVGKRPDYHPGAEQHHVHAGPRLYPARHPSRGRRLPAREPRTMRLPPSSRRSPPSDSSTSSPTSIRRTDGTGSLTDNEKQCVAFARVILQRPGWIVVNDALDVLDPESRMLIRSLFQGEFADLGMINIGHDLPDHSTFYGRKLHIVLDPLGVKFTPESEHGMPEPTNSASESVSAR